jgi:hypothetical protein
MEGEQEPAEIGRIKRDLATRAADEEATGAWLERAMEAAWRVAETLADYPRIADLIGERHRIIANDWQAASLARLIARHLDRSVALLEHVDFSPAAARADLTADRCYPPLLYAAAELIDRAADLAAQSASLVHDNERRWRVFRERVRVITEGAA